MSGSFTFAHFADVHLGAYAKELRELNLQAFLKALDACIAKRVDFILIAGDLFHINVPDLAVVERAAAKLLEVKEAGIPVYVWYGSHDYSPTEKSIIDVLASSGLFVKVARAGEGGAAVAGRAGVERPLGHDWPHQLIGGDQAIAILADDDDLAYLGQRRLRAQRRDDLADQRGVQVGDDDGYGHRVLCWGVLEGLRPSKPPLFRGRLHRPRPSPRKTCH